MRTVTISTTSVFEVNFGDEPVPFDKGFKTLHDGSKEGEERMYARFRDKKARMAARAAR